MAAFPLMQMLLQQMQGNFDARMEQMQQSVARIDRSIETMANSVQIALQTNAGYEERLGGHDREFKDVRERIEGIEYANRWSMRTFVVKVVELVVAVVTGLLVGFLARGGP